MKKKNKEKLDTIKILVLGGSQGAFFFDKMVKDVIIKIYRLSKISIYQQIFNLKYHKELENEYSKLNIEYEFFNYDKVLHKKLNTFDIAITRSGASALAELTFLIFHLLLYHFLMQKIIISFIMLSSIIIKILVG